MGSKITESELAEISYMEKSMHGGFDVSRMIVVYSNTEEQDVLNEIDVEHIPLTVMRENVRFNDDDPLLYDGYVLDGEGLAVFNEFLKEPIVPDFDNCFYVLECWQKE